MFSHFLFSNFITFLTLYYVYFHVNKFEKKSSDKMPRSWNRLKTDLISIVASIRCCGLRHRCLSMFFFNGKIASQLPVHPSPNVSERVRFLSDSSSSFSVDRDGQYFSSSWTAFRRPKRRWYCRWIHLLRGDEEFRFSKNLRNRFFTFFWRRC